MVGIKRSTRQKQAVHSAVHDFSSFFTAEELHAVCEDISMATIYRFLGESVDAGELFSYRCGGRTIYSSKERSHCHFTDEETGKTVHFDLDDVGFIQRKVPGTISSIQIEVKGKLHK